MVREEKNRNQQEDDHHLLTAEGHPVAFETRDPAVDIETIIVCLLEQRFVVEGFCHELRGSCSQRLHSHLFVAMRRDKDNWNLAAFGIQMRLQFETGHSWHADIGD